MLGVSKLASVLGVPGEQPHHNSRVEWTGECRRGKMNSMLWDFPNPNSLQGLCRLHCVAFTHIYPSWQTIQHVMKDKGWKMFCGRSGFLMVGEKFWGQSCNSFAEDNFLKIWPIFFTLLHSRFNPWFNFHLYFTTQLLLSLSPCFLFSHRDKCVACVHIYCIYPDMMECLRYACMSLPMHVCTFVCVCVCEHVYIALHSSLWILMQRSRLWYSCKS